MKDRAAAVTAVSLALVLVFALGGLALHRVSDRWEARRIAASTPSTPEPAPGPAATDDVALVGDSITEMADRDLRRELEPPYHLRIRGRGGYRIEEMEPYAIELATTKPEQVVINLGSNDILKNWPLERSVTALNRMTAKFQGYRCLHLVTVNEYFNVPDDPGVHDRAAALNEEIRRIAASNGFRVIDWNALVVAYIQDGLPEGALTGDSIHPTEVGTAKLSKLYREALDSCQ